MTVDLPKGQHLLISFVFVEGLFILTHYGWEPLFACTAEARNICVPFIATCYRT